MDDSQPRSMTIMVKTFSQSVFGDTLPNPTLVIVLKVKYMAVMYFSCWRSMSIGRRGGRRCNVRDHGNSGGGSGGRRCMWWLEW